MAGRRGEAEEDPSDQEEHGLMAILGLGSKIFYVMASGGLVVLSLSLLLVSGWQLAEAAFTSGGILSQALESIGLITIAIAVYQVATFLFEEELVRDRQLRSVLEARRSLTKFFTIIIITLSLEAIVLVFETKLEHVADLIYPTGLMAVAVAATVGLGLFQWLTADAGSNRIGEDKEPPDK